MFVLIIILLFSSTLVQGQEMKSINGTVTYIAGDAVYTSLGRNSGIRDSSIVFVIEKKDTIAVLKVFATSSSSSVCRILQTKRSVRINDVVSADVVGTAMAEKRPTGESADTTSSVIAPETPPASVGKDNVRPPFLFHGRVSLQYIRNVQMNIRQAMTQPGIVVNLRGQSTSSPLQFELYGNFRTLFYGREIFYSSSAVNQTRIYRLSVSYDDSVTRITAGRTLPPFSSSTGVIDGVVVQRKLGNSYLGGALGFEPDLRRQKVSTDLKKFSIFGNSLIHQASQTSLTLAYSRSFFSSVTVREVVNAAVNSFPSGALLMNFSAETDLRTVSNGQLSLKPSLTNLLAYVQYRAMTQLSLGAGVTAWRPMYLYQNIISVPDSMYDRDLRINPTFSVSVYLPYGITMYNTYSPRSSTAGFGKEYQDYSSISISNLFKSEVTLRGSMNISSTLQTKMRGYGASAQTPLFQIADIVLRYQYYRFEFERSKEIQSSSSIGGDLYVSITRNLALTTSVERRTGLSDQGYFLLSELSWRF
jgi:hypothetical protein